MKLTALDALQTGLENVARVMDEHGNVETNGGEDDPYYSLAIAADYLEAAERLLEAEQSSPKPGRLRRWMSTLIHTGTNTTSNGG